MDASSDLQNPPSFWLRIAAVLVDFVVVDFFAAMLFIAWALAQAYGTDPVSGAIALSIVWLAGSIAYLACLSSFGRQTLGYRLAGILTVRTGQSSSSKSSYLTLPRAIWRAVWDLVNELLGTLFFLAYLPIAVTDSKRSLPDYFSGALVQAIKKPNLFKLISTLIVGTAGIYGVIFFIIQPYVINAYTAPNNSMASTIRRNESVFTNELYYRLNPIMDGDVVTIRLDSEALKYVPKANKNLNSVYFKRVVGLPGQEIRIVNGTLYRHGISGAIDEPYLDWNQIYKHPGYMLPMKDLRKGYWGTHHWLFHHKSDGLWIKIPSGCVLVLGDDRNYSLDSHIFGLLPISDITGRVTCTYWPRFRDI